ncbi:MAG: hypothetical protein Hyperionvirus17_4 [Hyperionvirus sp.]|uniref:Uncharacterized protein n=1 Tax=Hyperionvirus sp. TaxID=2487770 RepID=A0A3G5ABX1_9VIRU|nr:MAG: hypothetical protein Hyperionvirus17_4 [Hyperionvirus sp.]
MNDLHSSSVWEVVVHCSRVPSANSERMKVYRLKCLVP